MASSRAVRIAEFYEEVLQAVFHQLPVGDKAGAVFEERARVFAVDAFQGPFVPFP